MRDFIAERETATRMRTAISFCKNALDINQLSDHKVNAEERLNFEKCLTENFLFKYGMNYFGKRDLIYIDLYGADDVRAMQTGV